ncbi:MAG: hypothetical protein H6582_02850 [Crocinitomicaceae bacterium]|nr:hypothetical protein [Crocinitomicaceae bacterium]
MKRILSIAVALFAGYTAVAQSNDQIQNKNGVDIMPVAGEFAVGIGATYSNVPLWLGNFFGKNGSNTAITNASSYVNNPNFAGSGVSIWGKYMVSDNNALRVSVSNFGSDNTSNFEVYDDRANHPDSTVVDKVRFNSSTTYLSAGWEFRRGKSRVRGVYGGEAVLSWQNSHSHYNYGNNLGITNLTPSQSFAMPIWDGVHGRTTQIRNGASFGAGVRAFVGVEFFFAPKMSIGTEFGWGAYMVKDGKSVRDYERFDPFVADGNGGYGAIVTHREETNLGGISFNTGIDNFNSQVYFNFYF